MVKFYSKSKFFIEWCTGFCIVSFWVDVFRTNACISRIQDTPWMYVTQTLICCIWAVGICVINASPNLYQELNCMELVWEVCVREYNINVRDLIFYYSKTLSYNRIWLTNNSSFWADHLIYSLLMLQLYFYSLTSLWMTSW